MGAYWHIALPFEVRCLDRPEQTEMVEKMYGEDFRFDHIEREPIELPGLPGGKPFRREQCEKIYRLDANVWKSEFQPFYLAFLETLQAHVAQRGYRVYSVVTDQNCLSRFCRNSSGLRRRTTLSPICKPLKRLKQIAFCILTICRSRSRIMAIPCRARMLPA